MGNAKSWTKEHINSRTYRPSSVTAVNLTCSVACWARMCMCGPWDRICVSTSIDLQLGQHLCEHRPWTGCGRMQTLEQERMDVCRPWSRTCVSVVGLGTGCWTHADVGIGNMDVCRPWGRMWTCADLETGDGREQTLRHAGDGRVQW